MSVLLIEPYYGDSHRRLIDGMIKYLPFEFQLITMPPRKWKWRMRGAAMYIVNQLRGTPKADVLFCSSFISLTDLIALGPAWLNNSYKIVYFHENQLVYPNRLYKEWDFHFGLTNITTALAADRVVFNSHYNFDSFLQAIPALLGKFPDFQPRNVSEDIMKKSTILPPPLDADEYRGVSRSSRSNSACLVWNHRWEFDKNPQEFFHTLFELDKRAADFELVVLGEKFKKYPPVFDEAHVKLKHRIRHWGYLQSRDEYLHKLADCDIVISTAIHEFFGIAVMEAVRVGCIPVLPNRLVYPDLYPKETLYEEGKLADILEQKIGSISSLREKDMTQIAKAYEWSQWKDAFCQLLDDRIKL